MPPSKKASATAPDAPASDPRSDSDPVVRIVNSYYREAHDAKRWRINRNRANREAFLGQQDWSGKIPGQSIEFLPKTGVAVEQFAAIVRRALTQTGPDWFKIETPMEAPVTGDALEKLLHAFLDDNLLTEAGVESPFFTFLSDTLRLGATESLCIAKVHWNLAPLRGKAAKGGEEKVGRLRIDLVPFENYFPDPTGMGLYEIYQVERDYWEILRDAEQGMYDVAAVRRLGESFRLYGDDTRRKARDLNQSEMVPADIRKKVVIRECWGTLLKDDGTGEVLMHNGVCAVANDHFVIRRPQPNPYWHGLSPFVVAPILRVPRSTHHKALFDEAAQLNYAINELFNLFIDGALAAVWGVRQVRQDFLDDPSQISNGIPQGETLVVNSNLPPGEKVVETITQSQVPQDAMAIFEALNREFSMAALTDELKLGQLPGRAVRATEIVALQQNQASLVDAIFGDFERTFVEPILKRSLMLIMQYFETCWIKQIAGAVGPQTTIKLAQLTPDQRFKLAHRQAGVEVSGISATLDRARDFQKLMALLQVVTTNPVMLQAFFTQYNPQALLAYMMKTLNLDPSLFMRAQADQQKLLAEIQSLPVFAQLLSQRGEGNQGNPTNPSVGGPTGMEAGGGGGPAGPFQSAVNAQINPLTTMRT